MARVGLGILELSPALVVKTKNKRGVAVPSFRTGYVLYLVLLPKAVHVPKRSQTALGADPGARQYN